MTRLKFARAAMAKHGFTLLFGAITFTVCFLAVALASSERTRHSKTPEIVERTKAARLILLADVDTTGDVVRYRFRAKIKARDRDKFAYIKGDLLPVRGPVVEPDTHYGDQAVFVFERALEVDVDLFDNLYEILLVYRGEILSIRMSLHEFQARFGD